MSNVHEGALPLFTHLPRGGLLGNRTFDIAIARIGNSALLAITILVPLGRAPILGVCEDYDSEPVEEAGCKA
jgi:hypothetical protein